VDGTGDAPTIQAGVDSAIAGDTVLVGPGTYYLDGRISVKDGITLISEEGPLETILDASSEWLWRGLSADDNTEITGFWIRQCFYSNISIGSAEDVKVRENIIEVYGACGICTHDSGVEITNNLIFGGGYGIYVESGSFWMYFINNNIVLNGIQCGTYAPVLITQCNNMSFESSGCIIDGGANFELDPEFCGVAGSSNYYLQSDSPCAPGNHPDGENWCGLIGQLPVGCGSVRVERKSWGAVKAIYKE
jgi:hypothetical protein